MLVTLLVNVLVTLLLNSRTDSLANFAKRTASFVASFCKVLRTLYFGRLARRWYRRLHNYKLCKRQQSHHNSLLGSRFRRSAAGLKSVCVQRPPPKGAVQSKRQQHRCRNGSESNGSESNGSESNGAKSNGAGSFSHWAGTPASRLAGSLKKYRSSQSCQNARL